MPELSKQFSGIKVAHVAPKEYPGVTMYLGKVAENQTGYRMVHEGELDTESAVPGVSARGYRSRGGFLAGPEKHSRGSTMFSATPLSGEDMDKYGATHQVEVDISGLPFRTMRAPQNGAVRADVGLGLGVKGEMDWSRIKKITNRNGEEVHPGPEFGTPGEAISISHFMDTGERTRGR